MKNNRLLKLNEYKDIIEEKKMDFIELKTNDRTKVECIPLYKINDESEAMIIHYNENGKFLEHVHASYELAYIIEGRMRTNQGEVKKGDILLLPPGSKHEGECEKDFMALLVREPKLSNIKECYE